MRTYRITMYRPGTCPKAKPVYYLGEVEDHQRADDLIHQAVMAYPDLKVHTASLVARGKPHEGWPTLAQGILQ